MKNFDKPQKWLRIYCPTKLTIVPPSKGFDFWFGTVMWGENVHDFKLPYFMFVWLTDSNYDKE